METLSRQILLTLSLHSAELSAFDLATEICPHHWQIPENLAGIRAACRSLQEQGRIQSHLIPFDSGQVVAYTRTSVTLA